MKSASSQRCRDGSTYKNLSNIVLEVLATAIRKQKKIEGIQIGKGVKFSLFAQDIIVFTSYPQNSTNKLIQLINTFLLKVM